MNGIFFGFIQIILCPCHWIFATSKIHIFYHNNLWIKFPKGRFKMLKSLNLIGVTIANKYQDLAILFEDCN